MDPFVKTVKQRFKRTQDTAAARQSCLSGKWESTWINALFDQFHDWVRLCSHQKQTVPQTILFFRRTQGQFAGAHPSSENSVHIIQMNQTLTSNEPGCAPKVLVWKPPNVHTIEVNSWSDCGYCSSKKNHLVFYRTCQKWNEKKKVVHKTWVCLNIHDSFVWGMDRRLCQWIIQNLD